MRAGIESGLAPEAGLPVSPPASREACADPDATAAAIDAGGDALRTWLEGCYAALAGGLEVDGERLSRPRILARLATEPDPAARKRLFLALEPLWRVVDGDGDASPYRALVRESAQRWAGGGSPVAANEAALGLATGDVERWATATLDAWREAVVEPARARGEPPIEPWDWWWRAGEADRALAASIPLARAFEVNRRVHASLGADLDALGVRLDTTPGPARPPVPVAFTTFGGRPRRRPDGTWSPGAPTVLASYVDGGLGELTELVHETGHAIHVAAIRTRPAFADWPDADALTEALAELVSLDVTEPAWQRRWLPDAPAIPEADALRCRYADVVLDAAWALLEIRLHARPDRRPNDAWTELTQGRSAWRPTPSGPGGPCAASSCRSPATCRATPWGPCWRRTSGRRSAPRAATGRAATPAGTRGCRTASTGSGSSGRRAPSSGTCSDGRRLWTRSSARSRGRAPDRCHRRRPLTPPCGLSAASRARAASPAG